MQQLTQQLKSGHMEILEVPFPIPVRRQVLVRNHFSVISAGTEGKTVSDARKGYIAKAKSRRKEVLQVLDMIRSNGLLETYNLVMNKLEAPSALGYSCAGEVIGLGEDVHDLKVGDKVACGGQGAFHADVVAVNRNLCVKVPEGINLKHAAFTTIAAIAIQGIRQADLRFGESCAVIGLGLIGQITIQVLKASGIRVAGLDISDKAVENALLSGADMALNRNQEGLEKIIQDFAKGHGVDAVIITAGSSSTDPVDFAGSVCRKKGKVVIVGAVPTGFSRENYYKKELDLRMSSSYGPGRYDTDYEEKGRDYPIGYVRWTENRNMQAFVDLLESGKINFDHLITHVFPLEDAPDAYNLILEKKVPFTGVLIRYSSEPFLDKKVFIANTEVKAEEPNVGFIGAGNFAQNMLLPRLKGLCDFVGIATAQGNESRYVADKYGFRYAAGNSDEVVNDPNINTLFVVTRHNLHAEFVLKGIKAGKHVFVEKPLALTLDELEQIKNEYLLCNNAETLKQVQSDFVVASEPATLNSKLQAPNSSLLMVGFNRRFAPFTQKLKAELNDKSAKSILIRVNAGFIPADHWVHDPEIGGGRIIGEACHFIDLAMFLSGGTITSVYATDIRKEKQLSDTLNINLEFDNGSIANISYFSNGNKNLPKEYIEVYDHGLVGIIDDFKKLTIYGVRSKSYKMKQDKGHKEELIRFTESIRKGLPCPVPFEESYLSTLSTFKVIESLKERRRIDL